MNISRLEVTIVLLQKVNQTHKKRLHADAQTYAAFVSFAALHFTTEASPVWALVSRTLVPQVTHEK